MLHTRDFTRRGCTVGARFVSYAHLTAWYVCRECGGGITHGFRRIGDFTLDFARCSECGSEDFISLRYYERQLLDAPRVVEGLPQFLLEMLPRRTDPCPVDAKQAIADLFAL
jgi:hypothetical protein